MDLEIYRLANNVSVIELKRLTNDIVMMLDLVADQYKFNSYDQRDLIELNGVLLDLILQAELSLVTRQTFGQCDETIIIGDEWYSWRQRLFL